MKMSFLDLLGLNHQVTFRLYFQAFHHNIIVKNLLQALLTCPPHPQKKPKTMKEENLSSCSHTYKAAELEIKYGRTKNVC